MKRVCFFDGEISGRFHDYFIDRAPSLAEYFRAAPTTTWTDILSGGINRYVKSRSVLQAEGIDRLYRERDPQYLRFLRDFVARYRDYDLIVMWTFNPLHPEVLCRELPRPRKILGFIDDPGSTYLRGIPYLWAFDGAFYASPSYNATSSFPDALERWGCPQHWWLPLSPAPEGLPRPVSDDFFEKRDLDLVYVGNHYSAKIDRLIRLKRHFGARLRIHGRWPLHGYSGWMRALGGKRVFPHRVTPLTNQERRALYLRTRIGINLHYSDTPNETGNMRMYEVPAHGMMLLCDKAGMDGHARIFRPGEEAVFYDSMEDAIEKAEHYLAHDRERIAIAKRGFERVRKDYQWERNFLAFLDWGCQIRKRDRGAPSVLRAHSG